MRPLLLTCFTVFLAVGPNIHLASGQDAEDFTEQRSFQLYYGGDQQLVESLLQGIRPHQIVVVDVRSLSTAQLEKVQQQVERQDATLLAYISFGELHSREMNLYEQFAKNFDGGTDLDALKAKTFIGENTTFSSHFADAREPVWQKFVTRKVSQILATGVDGLFLDTVDTVDQYIGKADWDLDRRSESVTAMMEMIRRIKAQNSSNFIMQNRGLNLIGKTIFIGNATGRDIPGLSLADDHLGNPDAILFENAFAASGPWATQILASLDAISKSGHTEVFALGYETESSDHAEFLKKCEQHRFVPAWATNSQSLHLEIAR